MRTLIFLLYCWQLCVQAQDLKQLNYIQAADYDGVYDFAGKPGVIHFSEATSQGLDIYALKIFEKDLANYKIQSFKVGKMARISGVVSNDLGSIIIFDSPSEEIIDLVALDANGQIKLADHYYTEQSDTETKGSITAYAFNDKSELLVARTYTKWNASKSMVIESGVEFICFDQQLKKVWTLNQRFSEAQKGIVNQIQAIANGWLVFNTTRSLATKYFQGNLSFLNEKGMMQSSYPLYKEENKLILFPTEISVKADKVLIAGPYFEGGWFKSGNSKGLFFTALSLTGEEQLFVKDDWDNLNLLIDETGQKKTFKMNTKSVVHSITEEEGNYMIISELFANRGADLFLEDDANSRNFILKDYIVTNISKNGRINEMLNYPKEELTIRINGYFAQRRTEELSHLLKESGYFTFRMLENNQIIFQNVKQSVPKIYGLDLNNGKINELHESKIEPPVVILEDPLEKEIIEGSSLLKSLDKFSQSMDELGEKLDDLGEKIDYSLNEVDQSFAIQRIQYEGVLQSQGKLYSYLMNPKDQTFYIKKLK
jgi:hypothetical protein